MKALLIVDLQNDFLDGGSLEVKGSKAIIPIINQLQKSFDLVAATQDWHPKDHKSFAVNHQGKSEFDKTELNGLDQILWPEHCIQGTRGAEFSEAFDDSSVEVIFRKGMDPEIDSYSGFFDNGHRKSTGLSDYLKGKGVRELYIAGLAGDVCVYFTAADALKEGFDTKLIVDACKPLEADKFQQQLDELKAKGLSTVKSVDL